MFNKHGKGALLFAAGLIVGIVAVGIGDDKKGDMAGMPEMPPEVQKMMAAMAEGAAKAAPYTAEFKKTVGTWDFKNVSDYMGMKSEGTGTETIKMVGDFWLASDITGDMGGMAYEGHMIAGYDAWKEKVVGYWVDNMGPMGMYMEGDFDIKSRTGTYWSEFKDPVSGQMMKYKMIEKWQDDTHRTFEMYMNDSPTPMSINTYTKRM